MADFSSLLGAAGLGGAIGQAIVRLELDSAKYQAELRAAQAETQAGSTRMGNALAAFGGAAKAGIAVAGVAVAAFAVNSIRAASDLGEAVNKSNVIFGDNAGEIERWAETGAEAFGLSKTAALDAAGGFGAMLQTAGVAVKESSNMSKALVQLSGDMASFNNIDPTEALEKLRSGLAGEAEPLRRFGVFLSEAAVQQEAYRSGIAKVGDELTEAQKVQARYNIIFEQTTKQQGDFARTADSIPNQLRTMRAEFENISAEVGTQLLPIVTDLLGALQDLLPLLKLVGEGLGAFAAVGSDLAKVVTLQKSEFVELSAGLQTLGEGVRNGSVSLVEFDTRMKALADTTELTFHTTEEYNHAVALAREEQEHAAFASERLRVSQEGVMHSTEAVGEAFTKTGLGIKKFAGMTADEVKDWSIEIGGSFDDYVESVSLVGEETIISGNKVKVAFDRMENRARELAQAMREIREEDWINPRFVKFLSEQGPEWLIGFSKLTETEQRKAQDAWETTTNKTDKAKESLDKITGVLDDMDNKTTKHTVRVSYEYVGFDPDKPGMGGPK